MIIALKFKRSLLVVAERHESVVQVLHRIHSNTLTQTVNLGLVTNDRHVI